MKSYLLDTHIWVRYLEGDGDFSRKMLDILDSKNRFIFYLSPVSIWEAGLLVRKGKLNPSVGFEAWLRNAFKAFPVYELPVTNAIATRAYYLPLEHNDPADRLIAATAVEHELTLLTMDRLLIGHDWLKTLS